MFHERMNDFNYLRDHPKYYNVKKALQVPYYKATEAYIGVRIDEREHRLFVIGKWSLEMQNQKIKFQNHEQNSWDLSKIETWWNYALSFRWFTWWPRYIPLIDNFLCIFSDYRKYKKYNLHINYSTNLFIFPEKLEGKNTIFYKSKERMSYFCE